MNKKIPLGAALTALLVAVAIAFASSYYVISGKYSALISFLPERAEQYEKLSAVDELVRTNYYGDIDYNELDASLEQGYIEGLGSDYCFYISPDEYSAYSDYVSGNGRGNGINAYYDSAAAALVIGSVAEGSPAEDSVKSGDYITAVDGEDVTVANCERLSELCSGEDAEKVTLKVTAADGTNSREITLTSGYTVPSCHGKKIDSTAYIAIDAFFDSTPSEFISICEKYITSSCKGLIIDVRNCDSANFDAVCEIIDYIVTLPSSGEGSLATAKDANGSIIETRTAEAGGISVPVAVLINDRTAGSGELLAADIRDFGKGSVVGETSAGHGTLEKDFTLDDGGHIILTVAKLYPLASDCFDGVGVEPDMEIYMSENSKNHLSSLAEDEDLQLQAAIEIFK